MDLQLAAICGFTLTINLIGTLAFAVRIAAVRTRKIALAFALFNVLVLVSRTCNSFQAPFLANRVDNALKPEASNTLLADFRWILLFAMIGSVLGAILIPTFQRIFTRAVHQFQQHRSFARLFYKGFSIQHLPERVKSTVKLPTLDHVRGLETLERFDLKMIGLNVAAVALLTVGAFASLYAGYLNPNYRLTASSLSAVVNGFATLAMFIFIDPQLSILTDDVMDGSVSESKFRKVIIYLVGARIAGTALAQVVFVPAAVFTASIAKLF